MNKDRIMGLLDLWNDLFSAKKSTFNKTKKRSRRKISGKEAAKKKQLKTKTPSRKYSKPVARKGKVKIKTAAKVRKRVKESSPQGRIKVTKKTSKHLGRLDKKPKEKLIGVIIHYFGKVYAGPIKLKNPLKIGDKIHIKGAHDDFTQVVSSMQINRKNISSAGKGKEVGIKVIKPVHTNDKVYLIKE